MSVYIEYHFKVSPLKPGTEILIAQLGYAGFESFVEDQSGVLAYIQKEHCVPDILQEVQVLDSPEFEISFQTKEIAQTNWNATWEENFDPIVVDETCAVRAPFHAPYNCTYEIIIEPKMSFGTGHHETTFMMMQYILENDFQGKTVLDMGCGTAVLAILAEKRGASQLDAIDIDPWCVENSQENITRNACSAIRVCLGDATKIPTGKYHTVIANINRNILLADMQVYKDGLTPWGSLFLSGFYTQDLPIIKQVCGALGFTFVGNKERNNWVGAKFILA